MYQSVLTTTEFWKTETWIGELKPKEEKSTKLEMLGRVLKISFSNVHKFSRGEIRKNGIASLRFGDPISFDAWQREVAPSLFEMDKYDRRANLAEFVNQVQASIAAPDSGDPTDAGCDRLDKHPQLTRDALVEQLEHYLAAFEKAGATVVYKEKGLAVDCGWRALATGDSEDCREGRRDIPGYTREPRSDLLLR